MTAGFPGKPPRKKAIDHIDHCIKFEERQGVLVHVSSPRGPILNPLATIGLGVGSAWLSGFNLYATVLTLGLLQRLRLVQLPGDLEVLSQWWVIGVAGFLYLVEFLADKVPVVDSVWDAIHTFIRVPAGAVLAASAVAHLNPAVRVAALLAGGTLALGSHGTKASVRLAANTSPEPLSNILLSIVEDVFTIGLAVVAAFHPLVILAIVLVFVVLLIWWGPKAYRGIRRTLAQARSALGLGQIQL